MFWLTGGSCSFHESQLLTHRYHLDETSRGFLFTQLEKDVSSNVFSARNLILNLIIFFFPLKALSLGVLWVYQNQGFHLLQGRILQLSCFIGEIFKIWPKSSKKPNKKQTCTTNQVKLNEHLYLARLRLYTHTFLSGWSNWQSSNLYLTVTPVQNSKTIWICWKDDSKPLLQPIVPSNI